MTETTPQAPPDLARMAPLAVVARTATSALGAGRAVHRDALLSGRSGLTDAPFEDCGLPTFTGPVAGLDEPLAGAWADWDCRCNRLSAQALAQDGFAASVADWAARLGAARIGVFIGTSTAGVRQTERAFAEEGTDADGRPTLPAWFDYRRSQNLYSTAEFVRERLGLAGPCWAVSTACSSSAKVFATAARALALGLCDAAVVGGADTLCLTTLYGFHSLQLLSAQPCRPADASREGLSIGEAAGFALVVPAGLAPEALRLLGYGESSDAHHMSAPDPDGRGAASAMRQALARGGCAPAEVDYVNLHGTATPANDAAEDAALVTLFGPAGAAAGEHDTKSPPWVSSTKGYTGHTLGAAGILEAVLALECLEAGLVPFSRNTTRPDPALKARYRLGTPLVRDRPLGRVLTNSFGFGGSNASLLFGPGEGAPAGPDAAPAGAAS